MLTMKTSSTKPVILFVDDEQKVLISIERTCRKQPWITVGARNGAKALELMRSRPVDVVVSDMRMPEMKGAELVSHIADEFPDTACILMSGFSDLDETIDAVNNGNIHAFLTKPWDNEQLKLTVNNCLEYKRLNEERKHLQILNDPQIIELMIAALAASNVIVDDFEETLISAGQLKADMVLSRDLTLSNDMILMCKHNMLDSATINQIREYERDTGQKLKIYVYAPSPRNKGQQADEKISQSKISQIRSLA